MLKQQASAADPTELVLDEIENVQPEDSITVTGRLTDQSDTGIEGLKVSFTGTGAENLPDAITNADGTFTSIGVSPNTAHTDWSVQAHFAGDENYDPSDSNIMTYDTIVEFAVPALSPSNVELTGFGASVEFDDVTTEGTITVSDCDTPASDRYLSLEICLEISSTAELASDTSAHITVSFEGATIPEGYSAKDIDIFHDGQDITESRDISIDTVTGKTSEFSKFVVAVALHDDAPPNSVRQQIFLGDNNEVSFRDINNLENVSATISLSRSKYHLDNIAKIVVDDPEANVNADETNTVNIAMNSTSDEEGITTLLTEDEADSGEFKGTVKLTKNPSGSDSLFTNTGDVVAAYYVGSHARFKAVLDDVIESGVADITDYTVDLEEVPFVPKGGAIDLDLVDAQLGPDGKITVTISYANAVIYPEIAPDLMLFQRQIVGGVVDWVDITTGVDVDAMTVTGETTVLGQFTIGACFGCEPGGAGGGPSLPKGGVVLDSVALIVKKTSGGGGGSSAPAPASPSTDRRISTGADVAKSLNVDNDVVTMEFENVLSGGEIMVVKKDPSELSNLFSDLDLAQPSLTAGKIDYALVGTVFNIDLSKISFTGMIDVSIPYSESLIPEGSDESDVRFLHYDGMKWNDSTVSVNTAENTVKGRVESLSPVVVGIDDGTFNSTHFLLKPLEKIRILDTALDYDGKQWTLEAAIKNMQRENQSFVFIVQVLDDQGITQNISWINGSLKRAETKQLESTWTGQAGSVNIYIWDELKSPSALSSALQIG